MHANFSCNIDNNISAIYNEYNLRIVFKTIFAYETAPERFGAVDIYS